MSSLEARSKHARGSASGHTACGVALAEAVALADATRAAGSSLHARITQLEAKIATPRHPICMTFGTVVVRRRQAPLPPLLGRCLFERVASFRTDSSKVRALPRHAT